MFSSRPSRGSGSDSVISPPSAITDRSNARYPSAIQISPHTQSPLSYSTHVTTGTQSTAPELTAAEYTNPGLQTVHSPYEPHPSAYQETVGKRYDQYQGHTPYAGGAAVGVPIKEKAEQARICGIRRRWFILLLLLILLIVVGAVVGGVLGSAAAKKNSDSSGGSNPDSDRANGNGGGSKNTPTPADEEDKDKPDLPAPSLIAEKSGLAVAGSERNGEVNMRVFFQTSRGRVHYIHYNSTKSKEWTEPEPLGVTIAPDSNMLALDLIYTTGEPDDRQINLYYIDEDRGCLQEYCTFGIRPHFPGALSDECRAGSVKPDSSLAGYWPTIIFQTSTNALVEYTQNFTGFTYPWELEAMGIDAIQNGKLAALPLYREYEGVSVMYQKEDGKVAERTRTGNVGNVWREGRQSDLTGIPPGASMTTLAFAPLGSRDILIQYLIFQTPSGELNFYQRTASKNVFDATNWKGPSSSKALRYARKGTPITCITPSVWARESLDTEPALARCFFQLEGGQVRMVSVDDEGAWKVEEDILL